MKSPLIKIIIKVAITALAIGAIFYFIFSPELSKLAQNQIEVARLGNDMKEADNKLKELKGFSKDRTTLDATKNEVAALLPDDGNASSFILNIEQATSSIPIIVESLSVNEVKAATKAKTATDSDTTTKTATTTTTAKPVAEKALSFSASFTSDYTKALEFLKLMRTLPRYNTIESIALSGYNSTDNTINLQAEGKIYYGK